MDDEPFGAHAPDGLSLAALRLSRRTPSKGLGRLMRSLLMRAAGGKRPGAVFDLTVFGTERARLRPVGNLCEKRVFTSDVHWEVEERGHLARAAEAAGPTGLHFVDVGANVGLYTLAAHSAAIAAGTPLRALAVEPQPELLKRLAFNLEASGLAADVHVAACAVTAERGPVRISSGGNNLGETRLDAAAGVHLDGEPLLTLVRQAGLTRIDVLKIDIEGAELPALTAFFGEAEPAIWPPLIIIEREADAERPVAALLRKGGYTAIGENRMNLIWERNAG